MPRVHHVKKARKDNPVCKKGESYYWASFKTGPRSSTKRYWLTRPKQSQLTLSKMSGVYAADEAIDETIRADMTGEDISSAIQDVITSVEEVRDEYQESYDNMQDAFPSGCPTMEEIEEKVDTLDGWISELENAANDADALDDAPDPEDFDDGMEDAEYYEAVETHEKAKQDVIDNIERCPL
ncbi:MAG: hypothetical protein K0U20_08740 [Proteobacteria bacterium]|nr:hypothetical protein [Pseudomonadota bacterium]